MRLVQFVETVEVVNSRGQKSEIRDQMSDEPRRWREPSDLPTVNFELGILNFELDPMTLESSSHLTPCIPSIRRMELLMENDPGAMKYQCRWY
jgi:hypothetical protein